MRGQNPGQYGRNTTNAFTLDDEADLLGLGSSAPAAPTTQQQRQGQQRPQQPQQQQAALIDLLDAPLSSTSAVPAVPAVTTTAASASASTSGAQSVRSVRTRAPILQQQHQHQHQTSEQPQQPQLQPAEVLSLRGSQSPGTHRRQGSLGYGDRLWLDDEPTEHPMDAPEGADATLLMADGSSAAGAAAAAVGAAGGAGGGRGRPAAVEGVHGGDRHMAEDEETRTVQVQTLSGEGVLTRWQRFLKAAGVRSRRPPGAFAGNEPAPPPGAFAGNELVTSKYNLLSFIPVNLYHQFRRVANMYFAALVCLQAIPGLSPVPWWGTLFPLAVVLTVNGVKEAFDDFWRHKSDEQVNHRYVTVLNEDGDQRIYWKSLQVGDLVRLTNNEDVPADVVLLASSDPEGLCYVETANLDGETNLKVKFCHQQTSCFDCAEAFSRAGYFTIDCEAPNPRLYSFEGAICCWDIPPTHKIGGGARGYKGTTSLTGTRPPQQQQQQQWQQQQQRTNGQTEVEMAVGGGSGWYSQQQPQQQQVQQQQQGSPLGRRSGSPQLRHRQQQQQQLQRPPAAAAADGDSLTAAFSEHGRQVGLVYREPLDASNLLLRGCTLRKTEWVIGVVVFTGPDTKVVRNMLPAPRKVTRLETAMNRVVVVVLALLGTVALALAVTNMVWEVRHAPSRDWYLGQQTGWPELAPGVASWLVQVVRFIILLAQAVPISLYVSLETVKVAQCKLLYDRDVAMYYAPEDVPCTSRTTTLNEELGQVQYILSDKTGTLTQNIMGFVWASIGGKMYGQAQHAQQAATLKQLRSNNSNTSENQHQQQGAAAAAAGGAAGAATAAAAAQQGNKGGGGGIVVGSAADGPPPNTPHTIALDLDLRAAATAPAWAAGGSSSSSSAAAAAVQDFLLTLAVCNTVVPTATEEGQLLYQAASPDEEALVAGAAYLGTKLVSRSAAGVEVEVNGVLHRLELLAVLEFSSDRKRMSVVVRQHPPDGSGSKGSGRLRLLSKGADNVMLERLAGCKLPLTESASVQPLLQPTLSHLASMAAAGYRTLVVAAKDLDVGEYDAWASRYKAACTSSDNRSAKVSAACEELETGLTLLGSTAVEDKLQEGVPESIAALSAAGIKVWVLTGDKMETAISIGHTARLLHQHMGIVRVKESDLRPPGTAVAQQRPNSPPPPAVPAPAAADEHGIASSTDPVAQAIRQLQERVAAMLTGNAAAAAALTAAGAAGGGWAGVGLVVDGGALAVLLQPGHEDAFLGLAKSCDAVICCRVSPMQKAQVATLLKRKAGAVTLAIGDGANDVSMIQAAHIGVGISGREGRAAVQAADFAFGQFRFLVRLLLVHGRQSYLRCREVVLYAFYKNVAYVSCFVLYSLYSGFSAQSVFFPLYIATFNALWAAFPTLGYGLFEQDVRGELAIAYPQLYNETRCQTARDFYRAWLLWSVIGLWHGLACFYVPLAALARRAAVSPSGTHATVTSFGTAVMTSVVITVTLRVAIRTSHWTLINHALIWGTLALWLPFLGLLQALCGRVSGLAPLCGLGPELLASGGFWLGAVIGAPAAALLLDISLMIFQRQFMPRASQVLQEIEAVRAKQHRKGLASAATHLPPGDAAAAASQAVQQQLPQHTPGLEQQLRPGQQQQLQPAAAAAAASRRPAGGGIIALANIPSGSDVAAAARREGSLETSSIGSSGLGLLGGEQQQQQQQAGWGVGPGGAGFSFGADYNLGGPHTLGDMAAAMESWAPAVITASPATLAASRTKRQSKMPLSRIRPSAAAAAGIWDDAAAAGPVAAAAATAAAGGSGSSGRSGSAGILGRTGSGLGSLWSGLGRAASGGSDGAGAGATPAGATQPATSTGRDAGAAQQQQSQQQGTAAAAGGRAAPSRLGRQQQQQGARGVDVTPQFTLGGDDTL